MTPPPCAPVSRRTARSAATLAPWRGSSVCLALLNLCVACTVSRPSPSPRTCRREDEGPGAAAALGFLGLRDPGPCSFFTHLP